MNPQRCPRCWASRVQRSLHAGRTGAFDLHACETCGGVWLDAEAAARVLADTELQPAGQPPSLFCPCCNQGVAPVRVQPSGVVVDRCDAHGVWFDARELDAICAHAAARKGLKLPARAATVAGAGSAVLTAAAAGAAAALAVAAVSEDEGAEGTARGVVADALVTMPETVYFGAEAVVGAVADSTVAADAADAAGDLASGAADVAGDVASGAAEAGSSVLETLTDLLGALFD